MPGGATQAMSMYIVEERQHADAADAPVPPEPEGRTGVAGDLCVARRQQCTSTLPPPRALSSPRKPHARGPSQFSDGLPISTPVFTASLRNLVRMAGSFSMQIIEICRMPGVTSFDAVCAQLLRQRYRGDNLYSEIQIRRHANRSLGASFGMEPDADATGKKARQSGQALAASLPESPLFLGNSPGQYPCIGQ